MKFKNRFSSFLVLVSATVILQACGGGGDGSVASVANSSAELTNVSGVAATGMPIQGRVYLKDSSGGAEQVTDTDANGAFSFNVSGLTAPYLLRSVWESETGSHELYSFSDGAGRANINPLSNAAVVAAAGVVDSSALEQGLSEEQMKGIGDNLPGVIASLREKLAPLFALYSADINPITGYFKADHTGLDAMFDAVTIEVTGGQIMVSNKATSDQIFVCSTNDIMGGQLNMAGMPTRPDPTLRRRRPRLRRLRRRLRRLRRRRRLLRRRRRLRRRLRRPDSYADSDAYADPDTSCRESNLRQ